MPRKDPYDPHRMIAKGYLGDWIAGALSSVGVTPDRVEKWLGRPCGCKERQERLNALHAWVLQVARGKGGAGKEQAQRHLDTLMDTYGPPDYKESPP